MQTLLSMNTMFRLSRNLAYLQRSGQQLRYITHSSSGLPFNTVILFVPQQEAWVVERFGKFHRLMEPGLNLMIPFVESVKYVQSLKEIAIDVPQQTAITADNVSLSIDGVLYLRVMDPYKTSYGVENAEYAITQLAQTTMRSEIGKIALDTVFKERDNLNVAIVEAINKAAEAWGIDCKRYEIRDIRLPTRVQEAMQMQVEAERKKRASVLESEGVRISDINVAEGAKRSRVLISEAYKQEQINQATGEAEAIIAKAQAQADAIRKIAEALGKQNGRNAVSLSVAEQYIKAFGNVAKEGTTILLPTNTGDVTSMVAQALSIYKNMSTSSALDKDTLQHSEQHSEQSNADIYQPHMSTHPDLTEIAEAEQHHDSESAENKDNPYKL